MGFENRVVLKPWLGIGAWETVSLLPVTFEPPVGCFIYLSADFRY